MRGFVDRLAVHDRRLTVALAGREVPAWADLGFKTVTHGGSATATVLLCLTLLILPGTRHLGLTAALANLLSHLAVQALKRTVGRTRPTLALPGLPPLADLPDRYSFPSGHACAAMAVATAVVSSAPLVGAPLLALALLVGASRVYLRVHYVTDVVVGQMLGAGAGLLVALTFA